MASYLQLTGTNVVWIKTRELHLGLSRHGVLGGAGLIDDGVLYVVGIKALLGNEVAEVGLRLPAPTAITHSKQFTPEGELLTLSYAQ